MKKYINKEIEIKVFDESMGYNTLKVFFDEENLTISDMDNNRVELLSTFDNDEKNHDILNLNNETVESLVDLFNTFHHTYWDLQSFKL